MPIRGVLGLPQCDSPTRFGKKRLRVSPRKKRHGLHICYRICDSDICLRLRILHGWRIALPYVVVEYQFVAHGKFFFQIDTLLFPSVKFV